MEKQYLTDIVCEEYKKWNRGDLILITTPTGSGKTTFILNTYAANIINEENNILILVPRKILKIQLERDLKKVRSDNILNYELFLKSITIWTYQELEEKLKRGFNIPDFHTIVCDEAHYFLDDSTFNAETQLSYSYVIERSKLRRSVLIMISATLDSIQPVLAKDLPRKREKEPVERNTNHYYPGKNLNDLNLKFYFQGEVQHTFHTTTNYDYLDIRYLTGKNELKDLILTLEGKTICFIGSKDRGRTLKKDLESAKKNLKVDFVTADNKENDSLYVVNSLERNRKFSSTILITTSVLDVGVSIHDDKVKNVIIDAYEKNTFIQMLGRIRMSDPDQCLNLFIFKRNSIYFGNLIERTIVPHLNFIEKIYEMDQETFQFEMTQIMKKKDAEHDIAASLIYYDQDGVHLNELSVFQWNQLYKDCLEIKEGLEKDPDFFIKKQLEWLGLEESFSVDNFISEDIKEQNKQELIQFIRDKITPDIEKGITREEIMKVLQEIKPKVRNLNKSSVRSNNPLSTEKFNDICKLENLPFIISKKQETREQKRKTYYYLKINESCDQI